MIAKPHRAGGRAGPARLLLAKGHEPARAIQVRVDGVPSRVVDAETHERQFGGAGARVGVGAERAVPARAAAVVDVPRVGHGHLGEVQRRQQRGLKCSQLCGQQRCFQCV